MLDMHLKPEKYLTAEDVGCLVGRGERLVQQMYRAVIALCYDCIVISICNDCVPLPLCRCNPLRRLHALDNARYNQINPRWKPGS